MSTFSRLFLGSPSLHGHAAATPVPVVTNTALNPLTTPITATAPIALTPLIPATNIPTSWAITATSPSQPTWFTIAPSGGAGSGQVSLTAAGKTGMNAAGTGTESLTVTASNAGGTSAPGTATIGFQPVSSDAYSSVDGSPNAPTGAPQYATILNSYVASGSPRRILGTAGPPNYAPAAGGFQPPWQVAGVDYPVGPNSGTVFKIPTAGNLPAGVTMQSDSGGPYIGVGVPGGSSVGSPVLDSFDFTNRTVKCFTGSPIITNCKFIADGALLFPQTANGGRTLGGTVKYCTFDQLGSTQPPFATDACQCVSIFDGATLPNFVFQYNLFKDGWAENVQVTQGNFDIRFNVFTNAGFGATRIFPKAHGDWIQLLGGQQNSWLFSFNVGYQNDASCETQGWSLNANVPDLPNGGTTSNNVMIILTNTNPGIFIVQQGMGSTYNINNNFADLTWLDVTPDTGGATRWLVNDSQFAGPYQPGGPIVVNGNISMTALANAGVPAGGSLDNV